MSTTEQHFAPASSHDLPAAALAMLPEVRAAAPEADACGGCPTAWLPNWSRPDSFA